MAAQLVHRGPDDEGFHLDPAGRCGLGFRRLAIIDLCTGNQPVSSEDGAVWAVFNGEIYNFRELRAALKQHGHRFRTEGDSEVIVHLYEEHGAACFERLAGMFAIAIWDSARGRLLLARDRFGKKPLSYGTFGDCLYFASEIKAILALPNVPRELDAQSLHRYLLFQYVPAPHSIFRGFQKVPPGHYVQFEAGAPGPAAPRAYWQIPSPAPFTGDYADALVRLSELIVPAVEKRLVADVPLGAFLSGGVDSSIVVSVMRRLGVSPLRTFSIGFADQRYDESAHARRVAQRFETEHHEHIVTPKAREVLETLAFHYDEPFADSSAVPTYYVARWTRQSVTVALTGDGGDEAFAGYDRYRALRFASAFRALPPGLRSLMARCADRIPHGRPRTLGNRIHRFLAPLDGPAARQYLAWINIFEPRVLRDAYQPEFAERIDFAEPLDWFERLFAAAPGAAPNRAVHTDLQSYLPYDLLTKVDIASMACSLECRSPFLDHELLEFALSLPIEWRLGKRILKDWAIAWLPNEILHRPKMGFGVPVGDWFRDSLQDLLRAHVLSPDGICSRIFRPDVLQGWVEQHVAGRVNHEHRLWALLMLELWRHRWSPNTGL